MNIAQEIRKGIQSLQCRIGDPWRTVRKRTRVVRDFDCLSHALGWDKEPIVDREEVDIFERASDVNHRRYKDALVIAGACRNMGGNILEIGTAYGGMTAIMSENAPEGKIYTVNIPPEEMDEGGEYTTFALSKENIGRIYKEKKCTNVEQIFANTAVWKPELPELSVSFIDGCHDAEFVYEDTLKALKFCRSGSVIIWHDFNMELASTYGHIGEVFQGITWLIKKKKIKGTIYHLQDSFTGLYVVP